MNQPLEFEISARRGTARLGRLRTPHGEVSTPAFVAVGTQATVKAVTPEAAVAARLTPQSTNPARVAAARDELRMWLQGRS